MRNSEPNLEEEKLNQAKVKQEDFVIDQLDKKQKCSKTLSFKPEKDRRVSDTIQKYKEYVDNSEKLFQIQLDRKKNVKWREYLDLNFNMEVVEIMDGLEKLFEKIQSFERDPDNPEKYMGVHEAKDLRCQVDRTLKWLVDKIYEAKLEPISIPVSINFNELPKDIQEAMNDPRSIQQQRRFQRESLYYTPDFLKYFDFNSATERTYLKSKIRFISINLGFQAKAVTNRFKDNLHLVPVRCLVGSQSWHANRKKLDNYEELSHIQMCPFFLEFTREVETMTKRGKTPFYLTRFDMTHSHPLTMEYERGWY
ncbi:hypothetical protein OXYTRIMIC_131 [Oxytricha trifallax]|uniref:Uncharacterized protein n=1 Tax=Oxytricha trifallax TaxID=1172189 RepID=A0A073I133_9SPIT|nr:hypothetical protein OXYTRIMIC_131 [Oxytricha trifallax]